MAGAALLGDCAGRDGQSGGGAVAFWALFALRAALLVCAAAAIVYYLIAFVAGLLWFADRRRQRALGLNYTPPVTIFKPARGADAEAYENFASFLRQDYPEYQVIFGLREGRATRPRRSSAV